MARCIVDSALGHNNHEDNAGCRHECIDWKARKTQVRLEGVFLYRGRVKRISGIYHDFEEGPGERKPDACRERAGSDMDRVKKGWRRSRHCVA